MISITDMKEPMTIMTFLPEKILLPRARFGLAVPSSGSKVVESDKKNIAILTFNKMSSYILRLNAIRKKHCPPYFFSLLSLQPCRPFNSSKFSTVYVSSLWFQLTFTRPSYIFISHCIIYLQKTQIQQKISYAFGCNKIKG